MVERISTTAGHDVRTLFRVGAVGGLTDGELLGHFVTRQEGWAEPALAALVERHGPMVWGVCRRVLDNPHDAADAFQATFLVLVRRAAVIRVEDSLGRWLYGVSRRVALRAKRVAARRSSREVRGVEALAAPASDQARDRSELLALLDEEIGRLPERYRAAVVLCDLNGLRHEDAARQLGCAVGTVGSRLARGREKLRVRLVRRGLAPSAGMIAAALAAEATAAPLPTQLARFTIQSVVQVATGPTTFAEVVSASVAALTEGTLKAMVISKLKLGTVTLLAATLVAGGTAVHALQSSGPDATEVRAENQAGEAPPPETKTKTATATQPDSENAELVRDELDLLAVELTKKKAELAKAEAQREVWLANVAINNRLNARRQGMVSDEEMRKTESEVASATATVEIAKAEIQEVKLRMLQLGGIQRDPERLRDHLARPRGADLAPLERRMERLEQKLDQILKALTSTPAPATSKPGGDAHP